MPGYVPQPQQDPNYEPNYLADQILSSMFVKPVQGVIDTTRDAMTDPNWGYNPDGSVSKRAAGQAFGAAGMAMTGGAPAALLESAGPGMVAGSGPVARGKAQQVFPEFATQYPPVGKPNLARDLGAGKSEVIKALADAKDLAAQKAKDPKAKYFLQKQLTPEAEAMSKASSKVEADMAKNGFTPYFDPAKRTDVDPLLYPVERTTMDAARPAKQETFDKWHDTYGTPEARQRLNDAYDTGAGTIDQSGNWYFMGQLHDAFVKELGPEVGTEMFKQRFAKPMATTTGGQDPTSNLRMAAYGNSLQGAEMPSAIDMPYPIGGRYAGGNAKNFNDHLTKEIDAAANPKRFNFQNDFLGHPEATIDEQMMAMMSPDPKKPLGKPPWYAPYQQVVNEEAGKRGVSPKAFQDVAWAGGKSIKDQAKKGGKPFDGEPMINIFNRMIERTSRLTGQTPDEVVKGFIRADRPMYSGGPAGAAGMAPAVVAPPSAPTIPATDDFWLKHPYDGA